MVAYSALGQLNRQAKRVFSCPRPDFSTTKEPSGKHQVSAANSVLREVIVGIKCVCVCVCVYLLNCT